MLVNSTLEVATYSSDFAGAYDSLPVRIKEGFQELAGQGLYAPRQGRRLCSISNLFEMRHLVATFDATADNPNQKYAKVKYPVPTRQVTDLAYMVTNLKDKGAVCIDYIGEYWGVVPPALFGFNGSISYAPIVLPASTFAQRRFGMMTYESDSVADGGVNYRIGVRFEAHPTDFADLVEGCTGSLGDEKICLATIVVPRHGIAQGQSTIATGQTKNNKFVRKAPIKDREAAQIRECLNKIQGFEGIQCVGYRGESIPRIDLLLGTGNISNNLAGTGAGQAATVGVP